MSAAGWGFGNLEGAQPRLGGADSRLRSRGRGIPLRRGRLPGRGGAGPGQEEVSAPGHPPRGGFPESSRRERAPALRPGAGRMGRKEAAVEAEPQECTVGPCSARARAEGEGGARPGNQRVEVVQVPGLRRIAGRREPPCS